MNFPHIVFLDFDGPLFPEKILLIPQFEIKMRSICVIEQKMSSIIKHKASNINIFERLKTKNA